jgi:hypothetical protein
MLFLFGRFMQPMRIVLGAALLGIGIAIHQPLCVVAGGVFVVWGAVKVLSAACARGQETGGGRRWMR